MHTINACDYATRDAICIVARHGQHVFVVDVPHQLEPEIRHQEVGGQLPHIPDRHCRLRRERSHRVSIKKILMPVIVAYHCALSSGDTHTVISVCPSKEGASPLG